MTNYNDEASEQLFKAAKTGEYNKAKEALENGAYIDFSKDNITPLIYAAYHGYEQIVELLLTHGADISSKTTEQHRALYYAKSHGHTEIVKMIKNPPQINPDLAWSLLGDQSVAHISTSWKLGRKLTNVFNFFTRDKITISENLNTKAESTSAATSFDSIPKESLKTAFDHFVRLGGEANENFVMNGQRGLQKNSFRKNLNKKTKLTNG